MLIAFVICSVFGSETAKGQEVEKNRAGDESGFELAAKSKRLIYNGFDAPSAAHYRQALELANKLPFDGFAIRLECNDEGRKALGVNFPAVNTFTAAKWKQEWFDDAIADLSIANSNSNHHNFILVNAISASVDWLDDAAWNEVTEHFRLLAAAAKKNRKRPPAPL